MNLILIPTHLGNLAAVKDDRRHQFVRGDIGDRGLVANLLETHRPRAIINFAAETHVDRSIHGPAAFIETNVVGTFALLDVARTHFAALSPIERAQFVFCISTDEVFGSLGPDEAGFSETTAYAPTARIPRRGGGGSLVRAYHHLRSSGVDDQLLEQLRAAAVPGKLIPLIHNAVAGKPLPVYGDGGNVRDWLFVGDHCAAIRVVLDGDGLKRTRSAAAPSEPISRSSRHSVGFSANKNPGATTGSRSHS